MAPSWGGKHALKIDSPAAMAKLAIDRASIVFGKKKSGDYHSKSGDREIFIILSKIGRSPEKSGDLEALSLVRNEILNTKNNEFNSVAILRHRR